MSATTSTSRDDAAAGVGLRVRVTLGVLLVGLIVAALVAVRPLMPAWAFMWLLVALMLGTWKLLAWRSCHAQAGAWRGAGFLFAWPGMDARAFLAERAEVAPPQPGEWALAGGKCALGGVLVWGAVRAVPADWPLAAGWVGMLGMALVAHFGLFHLLSLAWRRAGVDAVPIMRRPAAATSVGDFWGNRWNRAFRDVSHPLAFRPLLRRFGPAAAVWGTFLLSGVVHDVVISWPAGAGFGLPTLYFLLQAAGITAERSAAGRRWGLGRGWRGWGFAALCVALPAWLLFHPPFVHRVVLPLLAAVGAR